MLEQIKRIKASMAEGYTSAAQRKAVWASRNEKGVKEDLKGDQHELDHDKDGKIEAEDLAKLRAKKMKKEESEQLDELSKETLGSYKHKAELSIPKDDRAYANRSKGINKAEKKMKKESTHPFDEFTAEQLEEFMQTEDYQQLDELSKKTLGGYIKSATNGLNGVAMHAHQAGGAKPGTPERKKHLANANKRISGIKKATDRLTKEAAQYSRAAHTDVKDAAAPRAPAEQDHIAMHKVTVKNGIPDKHEDGSDKVKGATKAQTAPKKNYIEDPYVNKEIYIQSFKSHVTMRGDLERM